MNNLYGWAMSEYLPYEEFNCLKNIDEFDLMSISEKSQIGYLLEVNLEYPDKLHELHNDYPLAPEKGTCMIFITILSKRILMLNCCLLTQAVLLMK